MFAEFHVEVIDPVELVPAPAQGALAIQIRENDTELFELLTANTSSGNRREIGVERKVLNLFEGGCHMPLAAIAKKKMDCMKFGHQKQKQLKIFLIVCFSGQKVWKVWQKKL